MSESEYKFRSSIYDEIACVPILDEADAADLAEGCIDLVIDALRRDARFCRIARGELELLLGDARSDLADWLREVIDGFAPCKEIIDARDASKWQTAAPLPKREATMIPLRLYQAKKLLTSLSNCPTA